MFSQGLEKYLSHVGVLFSDFQKARFMLILNKYKLFNNETITLGTGYLQAGLRL